MTHKRSFLTVENSLYLALFVLALALRLYQLNAHPLTDAEAREALPIYRLIRGQAGTLLPHSPAYFFFTYFAFLILGASDATARVAPALFGAGLVFVPALFGDRLGRAGALLTSGLLAVSASLLAASRSAEGSVIALFGLSFGLGALRQFLRTSATPWLIASAIALGVGLASGAAFLTGAFVFALTALVVTWINPADRDLLREAWARPQTTTFFVTFGLTVILVATVGLLYLRGLGALVDSWAAWLGGFVPTASGRLTAAGSRAPLALPFFLIVYEPLVVVFGLIGAARAVRASTTDRLAQSLSWLSLMALVFLLLYSGRTMPDVIWLTLPLTALAAWALVELVRNTWASEEWAMAAAQLGVVGALLGFAALNVAAFAEQARINPQVQQGQTNTVNWFSPVSPYTSLTMAGVALVLTVVISYLFSMGWSPRSARLGLTLGVAGALLLVGLGASWGVTQLRANNPAELWWA
ncbi:MAG: hypothetical protein ACRDH2_09840, partial [Anaerolineales bacterium]